MSLRVLHVGKFFPPQRGGMETFLADLIEAQRAQGIQASALVHGQPLAEDPHWLIREPVQFHLIFAPIALGFRAALARAIARFDPQVLHLHMPNNSVFWALTLPAARSLPWVVHWHSDVLVSKRQPALSLAYSLYRHFERRVLDHSDSIIATSAPYLAASEPLAPWRDKCAVIPLGLRELTPATPLQELPWRGTGLRLLSVGRLTYYKGFETLVRAVASLEGFELVIAGDGEQASHLKSLARTLTRAGRVSSVQFLGEIDESLKNKLLATCDLFCLPSLERTEAFGLAVLEAMQHGKPCLVSDIAGSGLPWLVRTAGAGWCVPPGDAHAWQLALIHAASDAQARAQFGRAGAQAASARFGIAACARATSLLYESTSEEPAHTLDRSRVLIVIPARDEAGTVGALLASLQRAGWTDVLVVDDHSTDNTASVVRAAGVRVVQPVLPMGAWGAMQTGIRYGVAKGYQAVVTMDADGQHEVEEIPRLMAASAQADLVIGAYPERASTARRIAWHWFRKIAGFDLRDLTSGFRYYDQLAMRILASREATLLDYQDLGTLLMLRRAGLRIVEVPVSMNLRAVGKSRIFHSWFSVARYMAVTTLLCLARLPIKRSELRR
jgi:glycosyltransferase involved in cell wall biosynthesis